MLSQIPTLILIRSGSMGISQPQAVKFRQKFANFYAKTTACCTPMRTASL
ncbi:hypothetical protein MHA_0208 [Mannheimia haemolytica PHL213]|nr:hypothetical protein MHH_c27640 [Mannheimia haemolytica M42548]EDN73195.1 hypothetical protein MHA_0208 [Mannheimia haemolytica PHL213]